MACKVFYFYLNFSLQQLFVVINIYQVTSEMDIELHEDLHVKFLLFFSHCNKSFIVLTNCSGTSENTIS
jgi:hypothetical protein